jgi:hypothetical protein
MTDRQNARRDRQQPANYEFFVRGHLGATVLRAFPALQAQARGKDTVLRGAIADQSALHGVLAQIESLGLELVELRRLPGGAPGAEPLGPGESPGRVTPPHPGSYQAEADTD